MQRAKAPVERVPLAPGQTILDVGSGTGFLSIELAQRCGAASRVIAVDPWHDLAGEQGELALPIPTACLEADR